MDSFQKLGFQNFTDKLLFDNLLLGGDYPRPSQAHLVSVLHTTCLAPSPPTPHVFILAPSFLTPGKGSRASADPPHTICVEILVAQMLKNPIYFLKVCLPIATASAHQCVCHVLPAGIRVCSWKLWETPACNSQSLELEGAVMSRGEHRKAVSYLWVSSCCCGAEQAWGGASSQGLWDLLGSFPP